MDSTATDPTEESIQKCLHQDSQANIIWVNNILQMIYGQLLTFFTHIKVILNEELR
jgi:hypothetical protein